MTDLVTVNDVGHSGFQLSFTLSNQSPLHALFAYTGGPINILRVVIVVIVSGAPHVIMDGVVTNHSDRAGQRRQSFDAVDHRRRSDRVDGQIDFSGSFRRAPAGRKGGAAA